MNTTILFIDILTQLLNKITYKIKHKLEEIKAKAAYKIFKHHPYIQDYIKHFYDKFEYTYIDCDFLNRCNSFDFTQIPETLKNNLIEYMNDYHCLHYENSDYFSGFSISTCDNIYITNNDEIYADFSLLKNRHNLPYKNSLDLFLKLEQIQAKAGYYPDIVFLDYYDNYYSDYTSPDEYKFLKTAMHSDESRLLFFIDKLIELNEESAIYSYDDNFIVDAFTPEFIKKINNNLSIELNYTELDADFTLHIQYEIPTELKPEQLQKLQIKDYQHTKYNTTIININVNIREWLEAELQKGYSWNDLKEAA